MKLKFSYILVGAVRYFAFAALSAVVCFTASQAFCDDILRPVPTEPASALNAVAPVYDPLSRPESIYIFAGRMSTNALGSALKLNLDQPKGAPNYDNYIVGAAYNRNFFNLGYGFLLGGEIGVADRFGHYIICCDTVVKSPGIVNSGELWLGPRLSFDGFTLFDTVKIGAAVTAGMSFATGSIGREREREIDYNGSASMLLYLGPELSFSLVNHPEYELVLREQHRSGADGTFGKLREGYNGTVLGLRYKF